MLSQLLRQSSLTCSYNGRCGWRRDNPLPFPQLFYLLQISLTDTAVSGKVFKHFQLSLLLNGQGVGRLGLCLSLFTTFTTGLVILSHNLNDLLHSSGPLYPPQLLGPVFLLPHTPSIILQETQ